MQLEALPEVIPEELLHYEAFGWAESDRLRVGGIVASSNSHPQAIDDAQHTAGRRCAAPVTVSQRSHSGEQLDESDGRDMQSEFSDDSNVQHEGGASTMDDPYSTEPAASRVFVQSHVSESDSPPPRSAPATEICSGTEGECNHDAYRTDPAASSFVFDWDNIPPRNVPATKLCSGAKEEHHLAGGCRGGGRFDGGGGGLAEAVDGIMGASLWHSSLLDQPIPPPTTRDDTTADTMAHTQTSGSLGRELNSTSVSAKHISNGSNRNSSRSSIGADDPDAGASDGGNDTVIVSKQLLLRYYQLENFAAEYFEWFLQQTQPQQQHPVDESSLADVTNSSLADVQL